jgi:hypothetical protein
MFTQAEISVVETLGSPKRLNTQRRFQDALGGPAWCFGGISNGRA